MRKMRGLALGLSLFLTLGSSVRAEENMQWAVGEATSTNHEVYAEYHEGGTNVVYSLDVIWGNMCFEYYENENKGQWNPEQLKYIEGTGTEQGWAVEQPSQGRMWDNQIKIVNRSNACVDVGFHFHPLQGLNINAKFTSDADGTEILSEQNIYNQGNLIDECEAGFMVPHLNYNNQSLTEEDITKSAYLFLEGEMTAEAEADPIAMIVVVISGSNDMK